MFHLPLQICVTQSCAALTGLCCCGGRLQSNIITPTTKAADHDVPISPQDIVAQGLMTQQEWDQASTAALALFEFGQRTAAERGLLLVDTKYEFGVAADGTIMLIDEIHTPDSSRCCFSTCDRPAVWATHLPQKGYTMPCISR